MNKRNKKTSESQYPISRRIIDLDLQFNSPEKGGWNK